MEQNSLFAVQIDALFSCLRILWSYLWEHVLCFFCCTISSWFWFGITCTWLCFVITCTWVCLFHVVQWWLHFLSNQGWILAFLPGFCLLTLCSLFWFGCVSETFLCFFDGVLVLLFAPFYVLFLLCYFICTQKFFVLVFLFCSWQHLPCNCCTSVVLYPFLFIFCRRVHVVYSLLYLFLITDFLSWFLFACVYMRMMLFSFTMYKFFFLYTLCVACTLVCLSTFGIYCAFFWHFDHRCFFFYIITHCLTSSVYCDFCCITAFVSNADKYLFYFFFVQRVVRFRPYNIFTVLEYSSFRCL